MSLFMHVQIKGQSFYTIIDDDASSVEAITEVKGIADEKGIKITFAVILQRLYEKKEIRDSLLSFQEQGFHICNHSLTHSSNVWRNAKVDIIEQEIIRSKLLLDSMGFRNTDYFVYPFGKYSGEAFEKIIPIISKSFKLAFNSRGHYVDLNSFNRFYIERFPIRKHNNLFVVKRYIDEAIKNNGWIVFLNHSGRNQDFDKTYLSDVIDYCQKKGLRALTVDEAYRELKRRNAVTDNSKCLVKPKSYTCWDEILDALIMHSVWIMYLLLCVLFVIIVSCRYKDRLVKFKCMRLYVSKRKD